MVLAVMPDVAHWTSFLEDDGLVFWLFLDSTFGMLGNTDGKEKVAATTEVELRPTTEVALTSSNVRRVPNPVMQGLKVITFYLWSPIQLKTVYLSSPKHTTNLATTHFLLYLISCNRFLNQTMKKTPNRPHNFRRHYSEPSSSRRGAIWNNCGIVSHHLFFWAGLIPRL